MTESREHGRSTFLFVPGAHQGGWCFERVAHLLRLAGNRVITPTLSGLGERTHLASHSIAVSTHIQDIVDVFERECLTGITLCGHSYGGMIAVAVADRMPKRIASLVLLDAQVPENGLSVLDLVAREGEHYVKAILESAAATGGRFVPPEPAGAFNVDSRDAALFDQMCTPQPLATFTEPFTITGRYLNVGRKLHVLAAGWECPALRQLHHRLMKSGLWQTAEMMTGHQMMLDAPEELAELLLSWVNDGPVLDSTGASLVIAWRRNCRPRVHRTKGIARVETMNQKPLSPLKLDAEIENWPLITPFRITGHTWVTVHVLLVSLEKDGRVGRGEATGVYYKNDKPASMIEQIEALRTSIEAGISRDSVQRLLPPGGARNALDCALWDLEAKVCRQPAWQIAGLESPRPLLTTLTCGADTPENMASVARAYTDTHAIKLKLTGEPNDADRVRAVRDARADIWLSVDANQGFSRSSLERLMPTLVEARVQLIEQPFPVGHEALLDGFHSPIPIAADESVQSLLDVPGLVGRFNVMNIKLDKCGGLTQGLAMAREARQLGLDLMIGSMMGTSLAMAPAFLLGQLCDVVDLDGPMFLKRDRSARVKYRDGFILCPDALWGYP